MSYPDPQDLATAAFVTAYLGASSLTLSTAQTAVLPQSITDASKLICREARRFFAVSAYDEVLFPLAGQPDKGQPDVVMSRFFPLQSVTRVASGRTSALTINNASPALNQDAFVQFTFSGDPEINLVRTGLTLSRTASGTEVDNTFSWTLASPFTTVQSIASAINAIGDGGGWTATVAPDLGGYKAADLYGPVTPLGVLDNENGPGVSLDLFTQRLAADCDMESGTVFLPARATSTGGGPGAWWMWPNSNDVQLGSSGWRSPVRLSVTAGWATIPEPIQRATAELVKAMFERLGTDGTLQSESADGYSYAVREAWDAMPRWVKQTVAKYRVPG